MSGPCCGSAARYNRSNKWYCSECDGFVSDSESQVDFSDIYSGYYGPTPKECECGADKTYGTGSNTHATWCPLYKK